MNIIRYLIGSFAAASALSAAVPLVNFSTAQTWDLNGITVTQSGNGFARFTGVDSSLNFAEFYFASPIDLQGNDSITISATLLVANTATNFSIGLFNDSTLEGVSAVYSTTAFNTAGYTTFQVVLSPNVAFNSSAVDFIRFAGVAPTGGGTIDIQINSIQATSAIPEPATFSIMVAFAALGLCAMRRRQRA
jgi:hypothetical protein